MLSRKGGSSLAVLIVGCIVIGLVFTHVAGYSHVLKAIKCHYDVKLLGPGSLRNVMESDVRHAVKCARKIQQDEADKELVDSVVNTILESVKEE